MLKWASLFQLIIDWILFRHTIEVTAIYLFQGGNMEKDIALGSEGVLKLKLENGFMIIEATHKHASGEVKIIAKEDAGYFLDLLAKEIPGVWDDAALALAKDAIKKL